MNKKRALVGLPSEQATEEALRERIKELRLIYSLSELAQDPAITVEQFLQATVAALPAGLRYSDDAWAAVTFAGRVFATANYAKTPWQQRSVLFDSGKPVGEVMVGYLSHHPEVGDAPFDPEERALLEPDEQEECLALCLSEVQRLREMTRNVLSMSRIQGEVFQMVSLPDVWQRIQHLLGEQLRSAGVDVTVDLPADLPTVQGSAEQLGQVLINLTLNAIDSMPNGGQVWLAGRAWNDRLTLTFTNNGPPIPAGHLARLFEPFFSTKPAGAGLGLFVCQVIVQQHGGDLGVANLPDEQGVCFTITLPAAAPAPPGVQDAGQAAPEVTP